MAGDRAANQRLMQSKYLPPCKGPKLAAFKDRSEPIEWLERLDDPEQSGYGHVFKVKIRGQDYALKIFNFFLPDTERYLLGPIDGANVSDDLLAFHTDPFFAECRAYARMQEQQSQRRRRQSTKSTRIPLKVLQKTITPRCYGFLELAAEKMVPVLQDHGIDLWADIDPDDDYRLAALGSPVRALVKEYILTFRTGTPSVRQCKRVLQKIKALNEKHQILHRNVDAYAFDYQTGMLFSFSSSWTLKPHCIVDVVEQDLAYEWTLADKVMFDNMVGEIGILDKIRAMPDDSYRKRLRSWK